MVCVLRTSLWVAMPSSTVNPNIHYQGATVLPSTKSFVDVVFNMGGATPKVWQNFNWITRSGEGEGTLDDNKFENMTVYNDYQISAEATCLRACVRLTTVGTSITSAILQQELVRSLRCRRVYV